MTAADMIRYRCIVYQMSDGGAIVITPFGDAANGSAHEGWAAVDISHVLPDGTSRTLCGVGWNRDGVLVFDLTRHSRSGCERDTGTNGGDCG